MTSELDAALRAAADGLHPDEAVAGLLISHGAYLGREDFARHVHVDASDQIPRAWIDWEAVISALDAGQLPSSGGEKRVLRIAASLAAGHPVDLRDAIPGIDLRSLQLVATAVQHAGGQHRRHAAGASLSAEDAAEVAGFLRFMGEWAAADHGRLSASLAEFMDGHPYGVEMLCHDLARFRSLLGAVDSDIDFLRPGTRLFTVTSTREAEDARSIEACAGSRRLMARLPVASPRRELGDHVDEPDDPRGSRHQVSAPMPLSRGAASASRESADLPRAGPVRSMHHAHLE